MSFADEFADRIHEALRNATTVEGRATYDSRTGQVTTVQLRDIQRSEQLLLGGEEETFHRHLSFAELQERQGVTGFIDLDDIYDSEATDEEAEAYLAAVNELELQRLTFRMPK